MASGWQLDSKSGLGIVMAVHSETTPTVAMRSAIFELGSKLLNLDKVLVVVLIL